MKLLMEEHAIPVAEEATATKPQLSPPQPRTPAHKPQQKQLRSTQASVTPQPSPYAALIAQSSPAAAARKPGEGTAADAPDSASSLQRSPSLGAPLPLPDDLDDLVPWERDLLLHLSRVSASHYDASVPTALHPSPLEILWTLEHFKAAGVRFERLQEAIAQAQRQKLAVRAFLNDPAQSLLIEDAKSLGTAETCAAHASLKPEAEEEDNSAAPAASSPLTRTPPSGPAPGDRVDAIDLTLLFEQSRCADHVLLHLRSLQARSKRCSNIMQLIALVVECEQNFQDRVGDLWRFLSSAGCFLFPLQEQSTIVTRTGLHSLAKALPRSTLDQLLIRCWSWNEESRQSTRSRTEEAIAEQAAARQEARSKSAGKQGGGKSTKGSDGMTASSPPPAATSPVNSVPLVFHSLRELVHRARADEALDHDHARSTATAPTSSDPSTPLVSYLLGPHRLIPASAPLRLRDLQRMAHALYAEDAAELDADEEPEDGEDTAVIVPDEGAVSNYEQLLFHLRVLRENHAVQRRAAVAATGTMQQPPRSSDEPPFGSFGELLHALHAEHQASLQRRDAIRRFLAEESELFSTQPLSTFSSSSSSPLRTVKAAASNSILSDRSLMLLYFRAVRSSGKQLMHHLKHALWSSLPKPMSSASGPRSSNCKQSVLSYRRADGVVLAVQLASNHGFAFGSDVLALIRTVEDQALVFEQWASELLLYLTRSGGSAATPILTPEAQQGCTIDAVKNLLMFTDTGAHTISYLREWAQHSASPHAAASPSVSLPFASLDDLVDALIAHHVSTVKRQLLRVLEEQLATMCPALRSLSDTDLERVYSLAPRSSRMMHLLLSMIEAPLPASDSASPGASAQAAAWVDTDERPASVYPSLADFLAELSRLSKALQAELDAARTFLCDPAPDRRALWIDAAAASAVRAQVQEDEESILPLFEAASMETLVLLETLHASALSDPQARFASIAVLQQALVSANSDREAARLPKRALLQSYLERCFVLLPFFRAKRKKLEQAQEQEAHSRASSAAATRRPRSAEITVTKAVVAPDHPSSSAALTVPQIDGLLAACNDDAELGLALLHYLQEQRWAQFESVEALVHELGRLNARALAALEQISVRWSEWGLVSAEAVTSALARRLLLDSGGACIDVCWVLDHFASQGETFQTIPELLQACSRKWSELRVAKGTIYAALIAEPSSEPEPDALPLFAEGPIKARARAEMHCYLQLERRQALEEHEIAHRRAMEQVPLPSEAPTRAPSPSHHHDVAAPAPRATHRGSLTEMTLPQQWPAPTSDAAGANAAGSLPPSSAEVSLDMLESEAEEQSLPDFDAPPFAVSVSDLHGLVMRYGFHTSFYLRALVDQRQTSAAPPPPMQSFDELSSAIERIYAAVTASIFNCLIHSPDCSSAVSSASVGSLASTATESKRGSRSQLVLQHQPSLARLDPVATDFAASLPQFILQTGITSPPSVALLAASLLTALALGQASSSASAAAPFSPSHPLLASLFSCAPDLCPYTLCFHLSNLADPWRSNSPWMECYRQFTVQRQQRMTAPDVGAAGSPPMKLSSGLSLPFASWAELVQAIRELHQIWLACRDSVMTLLRHNIDEANRRAIMLATNGVAAAQAAGLPLSFFPPHLPPICMREVDALIMHSQAGLLTSAWLRYYTQLLAESSAAAAAQGLAPPPPLFASVADLQAQLTRDVFEVSQALAFARERLRQLLVEPSASSLQASSSPALPLLNRETQSLLSAPALDEMFRIVVGGFQDARASLPLAPSPLWEQQSDASNIREALAVVTPASMHDLNFLLHHLAHCGRTFSSLSALLSTLRFTVHRFRTQVLPALFVALNYLPGRTLCGFLPSNDLDQALSMDGIERLVRGSNTGIYAEHIVRCWIEGVPTVGPEAGTSADAATSKPRSVKQRQQWGNGDAEDDAAMIAVGPFPTLDALIAAVDTEFRTTLLPAIHAHQAEMLSHLQSVVGDLFGPSSLVVVDSSSVADLFDRSGAWFQNLALLRRFDEEMLRFSHFDALAAHMIVVRGEEARDRQELLRFLQDPRCALFAPPPWEQEENGDRHPSRPAVSPITPRQVDRLLLELGAGSSASQALSVLQDLADRSARFASVVDLTLTLKDRARDAANKQQQVLDSIGTLLGKTKLVGSGAEAAGLPLSHRTLKQLLKVSGSQPDVCLSLIKSLNIYALPISADKSSLPSEVVPPAPFATAAAAAESIKASSFGAAGSNSAAAVDSSMSPQAKQLVSQLALLHREVVDERDRMTEFFATATVVRPPARSAMLRGEEQTLSASAASTDQHDDGESEEVVDITPAQLQLQAAQFNTDRCRIWKQLQSIEQALLASKPSATSRAATSSKHVRSLIARSALVPEVPSELAMGLIVVAGSSNRTMDLLLRLNRDEAFGFRSMSELTEALRNAYLTSLEQQRAVAQFLASQQCSLLPREGLPAAASTASSKPSEVEPLTLGHVLDLLRAFGHGALAAPQLLAYLQQLNGISNGASSSSSSEVHTARFSSVADLAAHLQSYHRDLFAAQAREVHALLNSPECLLLRGQVLVPGTGDLVPASVVVTLSDAEALMRDSTAGIHTMVHLRSLRERWFQCASLQRLAAEVRVRVTWDGVEGMPMRVNVAAVDPVPVPVTPSVTEHRSNRAHSFPPTPAAAPAPSPSADDSRSYLDPIPLEQLQPEQ